jgi:glutaconate CoA-transferase subunit A
VIVSCEELVSPAELRKESWSNSIPHVLVDAVVHQPLGAHPTACYLHYDYDMEHLLKYKELADDDNQFETYLKEFVLDVDCHDDYLKLIGAKQLKSIKASPELGYARRDSNL